MVTADYYYPGWESTLLIFLQSGVEKLLATLDPSSQFDLSAMALWVQHIEAPANLWQQKQMKS